MLDCIVFGVRTCNQGSTCIYLAYFIQKFHAEIAKNALLGLRNLKSLYKKCLSVSSSWCLPKMYSGHPTKLHFSQLISVESQYVYIFPTLEFTTPYR